MPTETALLAESAGTAETAAAAEAAVTTEATGVQIDELLVEEVSIDGMCGVY